MKKYQTAKELLATKAENKEKKPIYATRKLSIGLVSCMLGLVMVAPIARAEEVPPAPGVEAAGQKEASAPADEDLLTDAEIKEIEDRALNLGDNKYVFTSYRVNELKERLRKIKAENPDNFAQLKKEAIDKAIIEFIPANRGEERNKPSPKPSFNEVKPGETKVSGKLAMSAKRRKDKNNDITIAVTVTRAGGATETKSVTILHTNENQEWFVTLDSELQYGDSVSVTQTYSISGIPSDPVVKTVEKKDKDKYEDKIVMPEGVIWIEDTSANLPDFIEKNKALEMFWAKNENLRSNIKSVEFSINGTTNAYYEVTFKDESKLKVEATELKIKNPTETTPKPEIQQTFVADGNIVIKLNKKVAKGTAYGVVKYFDANESNKQYCDGTCKLDKTTTTWYTLDEETDTITYPVTSDFLEYGRMFGVAVKEYGKKSNCQKKSPEIKIPELIGVRDPKKLTPEEKNAIDGAIRKANTRADGVSKIDGTGLNKAKKAFIEVSDDGNVKIIAGGDVKGTWDNETFVPDKDQTGVEGITIKNTQIIENKAPEIPGIVLSNDKKTITVTPNSADTDATEISVTYTPEGASEATTITAKKGSDNKWKLNPAVTGIKVDETTGEFTINTSIVAGGTQVHGSVKDAGFEEKSKEDDKKAKISENGETVFSKSDKLKSMGELDPVVMKKWVGDTINWKDGVKVKDSVSDADKAKMKALLDETTTTFTDSTRNTNDHGEYKGTIKVTFSDGSFIEVANQTLYVKNHVLPVDEQNVPDGALDVEFKLGEGVKAGDKEGNKTAPVSYGKYKVKPGTNLKTYKLPNERKSVVDSIELTPQNEYKEPAWNYNGQAVTDFIVNANKVFIATAKSTAIETFTVTVKPNGGNGNETVVTKNKGDKFILPPANTFTPQEGKEFDKWEVDGTKYDPNAEITIDKNTVVKATWKAKGTGTTPGTGGTTIPEITPDPSQPGGTTPEPTPSAPEPGNPTQGSENPKDNPTDPAKNNPDPKDKPEDKKPGEDNKNNPKTPKIEKGDKVINVGDKEVVVPKVIVDKKKGKLDKEERTKIAEKIKQKNPDVVDVKIDEKANAYVTFNDGRRERILAKDLVSKEGFVIPRRDRHSQDESPNRRRAGKNVKTGVESIAGIACTLVASTGALYIGRKKED